MIGDNFNFLGVHQVNLGVFAREGSSVDSS